MAIGLGLAGALNSLGILLHEGGRAAEAEEAYFRAAQVYEALGAANPGYRGVGEGLAGALNNLGILLNDAGRTAAAEQVFGRAREAQEANLDQSGPA